VLLIILDTVRAASLSLYGYARPTTPGLAHWSTSGVVFEQAIATAPWTLPSHGSLFTGRYPTDLTGDWRRPIMDPGPTLADRFRAQGYATGGFVANLRYTSYQSGLATGFDHYEDHPYHLKQVVLHSTIGRLRLWRVIADGSPRKALRALIRSATWELAGDAADPGNNLKPAEQVTAAFLAWQQRQAGRPFFGFLNLFDAHGPYQSPPAFRTRFGPARARINLYDGAIAYLDQTVTDLLQTLADRGVLDHTIVILTADHGEQFGEHGLTGHANSLYLPLLQVPLLIRFPPRVPAGRRIPAVVSLRDVPATLLDLAGIAAAGGLPGTSLVPLWDPAAAPARSPAVSEVTRGINLTPDARNSLGPMRGLLEPPFHYIRDGAGREELYNLAEDPAETTDLATTDQGRQRISTLRSRLAAILDRPDSAALARH
jgi:arylsulfatase A-like enzyme